jgi:hypothetical protein
MSYLLVTIFIILVTIGFKRLKKKQELTKIDNSFSEESNQEEKFANLENQYESKKEINDLNKWGAP